MGISPHAVACRVSEAWQRIKEKEVLWQDLTHLLEAVEVLLENAGEPSLISIREEARSILSSLRGHPNHAPETPVLDELGRALGRRDPIISVDEAVAMLRRICWRLEDVRDQRAAGFGTEPVPADCKLGKAAGEGPSMLEFVYVWPDGREEVRYRRQAGSPDAEKLLEELERLQKRHGAACPYRVREGGSVPVAARS
jgi:hypothetical protein